MIAAAVVIALVGSVGIWWAVTGVDGDKVDAVDCSTLEADDFGAANALAIACGEDVEVTGERTPWQTSWAGPKGTSTLEASAVPIRTRIDGEWVPIDPALVVGDQSIDVAAPAYPISLNPGGEAGAGRPLGTIERDGHLFKVWFPLDLPVPVVEESRVIYELAPGVRLLVTINVDTTGFIPVVELADPAAAGTFAAMLAEARAAAAAPGSGYDLGFAVEVSEGLGIAVDEFAQLQVTNDAEEVQFFAPAPTMWDSAGGTVIYDPEVTEVASTDRAIQPSDGDAIATMNVALAGSTVVVSPNAAMLTRPDTVWPVYIDPSFSGYGAAIRIATRTGGYTSTLYQWTNISSSSPGQGSGLCNDPSCNVTFKQRLIWRFDGLSTVANLAGADIQSASFTVNGVHSYNCNARTTALWRTADISASSNWSLGWLQALGTRTESQRPSCGTNGYRSFDATAGFVWMADANATTISLGLYNEESTMANWKRFAYDATIAVTYNRAPDVPSSLQLTSPSVTTCVTGTGRPAIATTTPTVSAIVTDPDLTTVQASFEVAPVTALTAPVWSSGNLAAITNNTRASAAVPAAKLANGTAYAWRARGYDGSRYGAWSGWCEFTVDTSPPVTPTVVVSTVGVQAAYYSGHEYGGVGQQGKFTLSRAGSTDVTAFTYGFNNPAMPLTATPDGSGNAIITFT
ncbi:MAG: hypothetical protein ABIQ01_04360, partial [Pseudolysinimonas sp.]